MRNTPAGESEGVECQLPGRQAPSTPNHTDTQTAVGPRILIERVIAYRVRVSPQCATLPYASGEPEIFTTHMAAKAAAVEAGKGWGWPVADLSGEGGQ